jgi:hypothetical protein
VAASQKISELTTAGPLTGAELVPIVQNGGTLQTTVSVVAAFAVVSLVPVVSALATRIEQVSAAVSVVNARVDAVIVDVAALDVRLTQVSAAGTDNTAALVSVNDVVSALEVRVSAVSATGVANTQAITSINVAVSSQTDRLAAVSALVSANATQIAIVSAATSVNAVQIAAVSALTSVNAAAITSVNAVVSVLDVRVSALEAAVSAIGDVSAITALVSTVAILDAEVSALTIRVADVSVVTSVNSAAITSINAVVSTNTAAITSINAVVSTKANRIGDFLDSVQYIGFDTSVSTIPTSTGRFSWNSEDGTIDVGLYDGVILKTGQNTLYYVKNDNSVNIPKGSLVMATGTLGASGKIIAELAVADGTISPEYFLGVAANAIDVGDFGYVTDFGLIRGFDTTGAPYGETWVNGQVLYANASVTGGLTNTPPAFPGFSHPIAIVINAATTNTGSIFVRMKSGEYLRQLHDVDISTQASNDILIYNTSLSAWTNSQLLVETQASISALNIQVAAVSALASVNAAAITSISDVVSALEIRVSAVSAVGATNAAAITSINGVVSALEIRVSAVSAQASAIQTQVNAVSVLVSSLNIRLAAVSASVSALQVQVNAVSAAVSSALVSVGQRVLKIGDTMTGPLVITSVSADKAAVSATGFLADSIGNVRTIIQNSRTSAYTLVTSDAGKYISITSGGITVPQNVFLPGDAISIFNNSANNQTVTQGTSVTMYLAGTSLTGNRTLAQRGLSTVLCVTSVVFVISGAGLS